MPEDSRQAVADAVAAKAEALYRSRRHMCADGVLLAFNDVFDGGLTEQQAVGLTAGLSMGQGESGCLCGAVGGGALALGLLLSEDRAFGNSAKIRSAVKELHERFKFSHRSTCCRVLTRDVKHDKVAHFDQCALFTHDAARMVADILLDHSPELTRQIDNDTLSRRDGIVRSVVCRVFDRLFR